MVRKSFVLTAAMLLSGCVAYSAVAPGTIDYSGLKVTSAQAWNVAPGVAGGALRKDSLQWTQDGLLLDRIVFIPAVADGETLFRVSSGADALPSFQADMLPNEIEEIVESSIVKLFAQGEVSVDTQNLRPHKFGETQGVLFDMQMAVSDGPDYSGITGAFVNGGKLYVIIYLGAQPYYFDKHKDEALAIIRGARV
ncbi:MAG: hypothetical protein P8Y61_09745 [Gammaproteobacteria bacterium]|jgi:hypothetical protein